MIDKRFNRYDLLAAALLLAAVLSIFGPLLNHMVRGSVSIAPFTDHPAHNVFAAQMRQERRIVMPHPLYHFTVIALQKMIEPFRAKTAEPSAANAIAAAGKEMQGPSLAALNDRYASASVATLLLFQVLLAVVLWVQIRDAVEPQSIGSTVLAVLAVLALLLVGPLALFHAADGRYYFGYIGIHVWHSPTVIVAKPLALPTFLGTLTVFRERAMHGRAVGHFLILVIVVVLGALAKPSFLLCLIPAACVVAFLRREKSIRWDLLLGVLILPAAVVIFWQSRVYASLTGGSHAKFAPFATMSSMSNQLAIKFILSILFPVTCYIAWPEARQRFRLNFAWIVFFFGIALTYLIKESLRTSHGNFLWSAQLALFVLFVESLLAVIVAARAGWVSGDRMRTVSLAALCGAVLLAHLGFGVAYDLHLIRTPITTDLLYK